MSSTRGLPSAALAAVCLRVAADPEPLLSLTRRVRALWALAGASAELRWAVRDVALPALALWCPIGAEPPTPDALARTSDHGVVVLEAQLCTRPQQQTSQQQSQHNRRPASVERLLELGRDGGALWRLVALKREVRARGLRVLSYSQAVVAFRLRRSDLPAGAAGAPYSRDDLRDVALARHGGARAMEERDRHIRDASDRRAATREARDSRRRDVAAACASIAGPDRERVAGLVVAVEFRAAAEVFARGGRPEQREVALDQFRATLAAFRRRRAEVGALVMPRPGLVPAEVDRARTAYVELGRDQDLQRVVETSSRWQFAVDALTGTGRGRQLPASFAPVLLIESARARAVVKRFLRQDEPAAGTSVDADGQETDRASRQSWEVEELAGRVLALFGDAVARVDRLHAGGQRPAIAAALRARIVLCLPAAVERGDSDGEALFARAADVEFAEYARKIWNERVAPGLIALAREREGGLGPQLAAACTHRRAFERSAACLRRAFDDPTPASEASLVPAVAEALASLVPVPVSASEGDAEVGELCRRCESNVAAAACSRRMCRNCCQSSQSSQSFDVTTMDACQRHTKMLGRYMNAGT